MINETYDVIVVGAGHAGNEAAVAAANLAPKHPHHNEYGKTIGKMSCNPCNGRNCQRTNRERN